MTGKNTGKNRKMQVVSIRLPNETMDIIKRRCSQNRFDSVSDYLRNRIIYDITRKHKKHG